MKCCPRGDVSRSVTHGYRRLLITEPRLGGPAGPAPEVGSWAWPWAAPWSPGGQRSEFFQDDPGRRAIRRRRRPRRPGGSGGSRLPSRRGLCRRGGEVITAAEGRSRGRSGSGRRGQRRPGPQGERVGPRRIASAHCCPVRSGAAPGSGRVGSESGSPRRSRGSRAGLGKSRRQVPTLGIGCSLRRPGSEGSHPLAPQPDPDAGGRAAGARIRARTRLPSARCRHSTLPPSSVSRPRSDADSPGERRAFSALPLLLHRDCKRQL